MPETTNSLRMIICATTAAFLVGLPAHAQDGPKTSAPQPVRSAPVFPDEFSDLDEAASASAGKLDDGLVAMLEQARQRYLKALSFIEKKDTTKAAEQFESAITILNDMASYPRIEENTDFTDLAQTIIEDYEAYVQNIDNLGENSSVFILRERLFEEVDASITKVETITPDVVTTPTTVPETTIPLTFNEHVEKNIRFLTVDKGRKFMKRWLERSGRWFDMFRRIAKEEEMPEEIIHLAMMESGLNPTAVSWAKAVGLWQFIKPTGEEYDLDVTFWQDERRDPEKATRAAMRFLKDLHRELGDWHLALAAYNCGAGGVRRAMRKSGVQNGSFWDIRESLPRETRHYVPMYIATTLITLNREQYGFTDDSLEMHPTYDYETFTVPDATNLSALARCADISVDSLRALNPELIRTCTPPGQAYKLKVPKGTSTVVASRFATLTDDDKRPWMVHTVARGETLAKIARRYGVSASDIASVNGLRGYNAKVRRGASLRIPIATSSTSLASTTKASTPADSKDGTSTSVTTTSSSTAASSAANVTSDATREASVTTALTSTKHVVSPGDNLNSIAKRYGVRLADLRNWNNIPYDRENIFVGDTLVVARTDRAVPTVATNVERIAVKRTVSHTIARGETLASIATLYGTTQDRLHALNRLPKNGALKAGRTLNVETSLSKSEVAAITKSAPTGKAQIHKVRKGESLGSIAALYGVDESDLRRWNADVVEGTTVFANSKLKVYGGTTSKGSAGTTASKKLPKSYRVRRGDTLTGIADKFGVSIDEIRRKNPSLRTSDVVRSGQRIRLQ